MADPGTSILVALIGVAGSLAGVLLKHRLERSRSNTATSNGEHIQLKTGDSNFCATLALILAIFSFTLLAASMLSIGFVVPIVLVLIISLLAVVLAHVALARASRSSTRSGRWAAIASLFMAYPTLAFSLRFLIPT